MSTQRIHHTFEVELELAGSADDVWHAIATAEGITSWMLPTELEERAGGAVTFHMGPGEASRGRVTGFEPTRRIAYEEDWATLSGHPDADVTPLATEFLVQARSGGTCVVRVVTSAFGTGAEWEHEFWHDMSEGWGMMLDNLRVYVAHFPGQRATTLSINTTFPMDPAAAMAAVRDRIGIAGDPGDPGEPVAAVGLTGRVERSHPRHLLVRTDEPVPGMIAFFAFGADASAGVWMNGYLFSDAAPAYADRAQSEWQAWLDDVATGAVDAPLA